MWYGMLLCCASLECENIAAEKPHFGVFHLCGGNVTIFHDGVNGVSVVINQWGGQESARIRASF